MGGQESLQREHVPATTRDIVKTQIAKLREVFPEVFVEGKIDFDRLRVTLGESAQAGPSRLHFSDRALFAAASIFNAAAIRSR
jgi:hypothetical protein